MSTRSELSGIATVALSELRNPLTLETKLGAVYAGAPLLVTHEHRGTTYQAAVVVPTADYLEYLEFIASRNAAAA